MKKMLSRFSDNLLTKQKLKTIKGAGTPYCFCPDGSPVNCPPGYCCGGPLPPGVGGCAN